MTGVTQLGYLAFGVADLDGWKRFATDILGLQVAREVLGGGVALRMDSYAQRIFLQPGDDDVAAIGWEVADEAALNDVVGRLERAGVRVTGASDAETEQRGVAGLAKLVDPAGIPTELYFGAARAAQPFRSPVLASTFVADELGLGHCVVTARDKAASEAFYRELLGFRLSDEIVCEYYGYKVDLAFFHANPRHHTVAIGGPQPKRIHHFMLEVASMDDVGLCYDRCLRAGVRICNTLGRHPNDRMFSFYALTPSGFQFELGWGGREVDDATWQPVIYDRISEWGHHPPQVLAPRPKK